MRFTAQEEYGLRCLMQIARAPGGFLTITEIARQEGLTTAYAAKLMRALRRAGLVNSIRGQKGGFVLTLPPGELTVGEVLARLDGRLYTKQFCTKYAGNDKVCTHTLDCSLRSVWGAIDFAVHRALGGITLESLLAGESRMQTWLAERPDAQPVVPDP
ncbi:MAG: Rrf2 family transcriptional regulator [Candidatus Riflebacteria bacterium]|nr:Rrf2 family transcriptional regulator [Candidatus Riflebacteria bacterium]